MSMHHGEVKKGIKNHKSERNSINYGNKLFMSFQVFLVFSCVYIVGLKGFDNSDSTTCSGVKFMCDSHDNTLMKEKKSIRVSWFCHMQIAMAMTTTKKRNFHYMQRAISHL